MAVWLFLGSIVLAVAPAPVEPYDEGMAAARAALDAGDASAALLHLGPLCEQYPQDYAAWMLMGQAAAQEQDWTRSAQAYRRARALSDENPDATLGLAWALAESGDTDTARVLFSDLASIRPAQSSEGIQFLEAPPLMSARAFVSVTGLAYPGHAALDGGPGLSAGVHSRLGFGAASLTVRSLGLWLDTTRDAIDLARGKGSRSFFQQPGLWFGQVDGFASLGIGLAAVGASAHYHLGFDLDPEGVGTRHSGGLVGRWSPWGDVVAEVSGSTFVDTWATRAALSWRSPSWGGLYVEPGVTGQLVRGAPRGNVSVLAGGAWRFFGAYAGVRVGPEERPVYLRHDLAYPLAEVILGGANLGAHVNLGPNHTVFVAYEVIALAASLSWPLEASAAHFAQLGWSFGGPQ